MTNIKKRVAQWLRRVADRLDQPSPSPISTVIGMGMGDGTMKLNLGGKFAGEDIAQGDAVFIKPDGLYYRAEVDDGSEN